MRVNSPCEITPINIFSSISENGSIQLAQKAFSPKGGHLICILFDLGTPARDDVKTEPTIVYSLNGQNVPWPGGISIPTTPKDRPCFARWAKRATDLFAKGDIKPLAVENAGKLEDVGSALDRLMKGENKEKVVITVS